MAEASVVDANSPEEGDAVAEQVKERFGISTVYRTVLSPAIGTHGGPGTIAIGFYAEK
jgi:fatty acid-binding protein DegV